MAEHSRASWPWQFKKIDGVWHRRSDSKSRWQKLSVVRTGHPPDLKNRGRGVLVNRGSINEWRWL